MTWFGIVLLLLAAFCIVQAIRAWGPANKQRGISVVWAVVGLILVSLSGVFGLLSQPVA